MMEIDAASNTGVDNIRELIERLLRAAGAEGAVDECHMLSTAAFNALLKTLEEPRRWCSCWPIPTHGVCRRSQPLPTL